MVQFSHTRFSQEANLPLVTTPSPSMGHVDRPTRPDRFSASVDLSQPADAFASSQIAQHGTTEPINESNDGKFSIKEAGKNFFKGLISPITSMFESKENFLMGAAMLIGGAALIIGTGGAAAPFLLTLGLGMGAVQAGTAIYKMATAKDGDDIEKAFYDAGAATGTIGLSVVGAKASLKGISPSSGMSVSSASQVKNMSLLQSTIENIKLTPASLRASFRSVRSGQFTQNLGAAIGVGKNAVKPNSANPNKSSGQLALAEESGSFAARARSAEDFKYNMPATEAEAFIKGQATEMRFDPAKVRVITTENATEMAGTRIAKDGRTIEIVLPRDAHGKVRVNEALHEASQVKTYQDAAGSRLSIAELKAKIQSINNIDKEILALQHELSLRPNSIKSAFLKNLIEQRPRLREELPLFQEQLRAKRLILEAETAAKEFKSAHKIAQNELDSLRAPYKQKLDKALKDRDRLIALAEAEKASNGKISTKTQTKLDQAKLDVEIAGRNHDAIRVCQKTQIELDAAEFKYRSAKLEQIAFEGEYQGMEQHIRHIYDNGKVNPAADKPSLKPDGTKRLNQWEEDIVINPKTGKEEIIPGFDGMTSTMAKQIERARILRNRVARNQSINTVLEEAIISGKGRADVEATLMKNGFNRNDPDVRLALDSQFNASSILRQRSEAQARTITGLKEHNPLNEETRAIADLLDMGYDVISQSSLKLKGGGTAPLYEVQTPRGDTIFLSPDRGSRAPIMLGPGETQAHRSNSFKAFTKSAGSKDFITCAEDANFQNRVEVLLTVTGASVL
jgi:hypothetical protein